jgi:stage V sporulation protein G
MTITDIRVRKLNQEGRMKAIISVTFDDCFVVHDIKVIEGTDKIFVAMPSRRTPDGEFKDIVHPINSEMRTEIENKVLEAYNNAQVTEIAQTPDNHPDPEGFENQAGVE